MHTEYFCVAYLRKNTANKLFSLFIISFYTQRAVKTSTENKKLFSEPFAEHIFGRYFFVITSAFRQIKLWRLFSREILRIGVGFFRFHLWSTNFVETTRGEHDLAAMEQNFCISVPIFNEDVYTSLHVESCLTLYWKKFTYLHHWQTILLHQSPSNQPGRAVEFWTPWPLTLVPSLLVRIKEALNFYVTIFSEVGYVINSWIKCALHFTYKYVTSWPILFRKFYAIFTNNPEFKIKKRQCSSLQ